LASISRISEWIFRKESVMFTRIVSWLIVIGLINFSIGCAAQRTIRLSDKSFDAETKIISVTLNDGKEIVFDELGGHYISKTQTINGFQITTVQADHISIKAQNIKYVRISQTSSGDNIVLGIDVVALVVVVIVSVIMVSSGGINVGPGL
jgi:hypothetical protein